MARSTFTFALAGNPNSGKTTLFNALTGSAQKVGNWPGVTIEKKIGRYKHDSLDIRIVDLPGTYSLSPYSLEERITRQFLLDEKPDVVIQVLDVTNLERSLFLTTQLIELGQPVVLALNVYDEFERSGARVHVDKLVSILGTPAIPTVAVKGEGLDKLIAEGIAVAQGNEREAHPVNVDYGRDIETRIQSIIDEHGLRDLLSSEFAARWVAIKLLENDEEIAKRIATDRSTSLPPEVILDAGKARDELRGQFHDDVESIITQRRYGFISSAFQQVYEPPATQFDSFTDKIDSLLTHRLLGLPIFLLILWTVFQLTFTVGATPMDWIDAGVGMISDGVSAILGDTFWRDIIVEGAINGVGFVIVFLPNIVILFFCIAFLEHSGYMARAAFMMDRVMRVIGLHGKAFIPLMMGFGCNVPAVMAARTLDSERDRLLTSLINPLMSCSARLPVYVLLAGTFFAAKWAGTVIFSMYALGIFLAIAMGFLFSKTILRGQAAPFVMELPPYRMPTMRDLLINTWDRSKIFVKKMGGVILVGSLVVWVLTNFPRNVEYTQDYDARIAAAESELATVADAPDGEQAQALQSRIADLQTAQSAEQMSQSYLAKIGNAMTPIFAPMGFDWQTNVAILTGFVAKEIVVSTYGVIYQVGTDIDESSGDLRSRLKSSTLTPLRSLALMAFILIYTPCLGTLAAIRRETGSWKWTAFSVAYSLVLAWVVAVAIMQIGHLIGAA